ncbi:Endogenous retrovirus group PABLB member 1 Env polyprotein, partial [Pygoscelis papua]
AHASYYNYKNKGDFCGTNDSSHQGLGAAGVKTKGGVGIWNNGTPKALPPKIFLICGDRAWQGIPANAVGGPCYLGKLTLLAPGENCQQKRRKRSSQGLSPACRDDVTIPSQAEKVFLSLFIPGAAAGRALNEVGKLACWAKKQAKITTEVIESLLEDQDNLRHTILQNRAAIDFLLLAQGHGCEDFEGMCCMNLSGHGESIHKQLQWLRDHARKIQQDQGFLDTWLKNMFGNLPSWIISLLKESLRILIVILIIGICFCIIFS